MQADCVPSSSRLPVHDIWDRPPSEWTFSMAHPVSNCRSEAFLVESMAQPRSIAPIPVVAPPAPQYPTASDCSKFMPPARWEKAPGVLTDGKRTVYSTALPEVQRVLQVARQTLAPPSLSSEVIFTLAALSVFYHPSDPAHWTFWSDDKKNHTADIVNRIALRQPPLIQAPIAWNGKIEYLAELGRVHSGGWQALFESQDWYQVLVPPKPTTPPRSLSLRKRKVVPGAFREPSPLVEEEIDDLPSKQAVTAPSPEKRRTRAARNTKGKAKAVTESPATFNVPLATGFALLDMEDALTPLSDDLDLPSDPAPSPAPSARKKRKISPPSLYPDSILLSIQNESPFPIHASLLLGPGVIPPTDDQLHHGPILLPTHSRTRSTSSDTSVDTLVQSAFSGSRSSSVSDSGTAIEAASTSIYGKRKAVVIDAEEDEQGEEDACEAAFQGKKTSRARSTRSKKATPASADTKGKTAKAPSQPTKRKARKA
ncbi:hypothetical protein BKA70DRAFT_1095219 [Coprinopsis sp. MPI-PUGE-AT-0042]|nr:hypothetical protein BKA70DRAFT_1095219 [Coprinopsis sp. MPI-PUGE-AT-0042]